MLVASCYRYRAGYNVCFGGAPIGKTTQLMTQQHFDFESRSLCDALKQSAQMRSITRSTMEGFPLSRAHTHSRSSLSILFHYFTSPHVDFELVKWRLRQRGKTGRAIQQVNPLNFRRVKLTFSSHCYSQINSVASVSIVFDKTSYLLYYDRTEKLPRLR
jgi:hypothetical protein